MYILRRMSAFITVKIIFWGYFLFFFFFGGNFYVRVQYGVCHNEMEPDGDQGHIRSEPWGERLTAESHILHRSQTDGHVPPSAPLCIIVNTCTQTHAHTNLWYLQQRKCALWVCYVLKLTHIKWTYYERKADSIQLGCLLISEIWRFADSLQLG